MKRILTGVVILALAMLSLIHPGSATPAFAADPYCLDPDASAFLELINTYRQQNNRQPLTASPTLGAAALAHSQDMATNNYFSHDGRNGSTAEDRMKLAGYIYDLNSPWFTGENIYRGAGGSATPQAAFNSWRNSAGHNANMLSPNFTAIGIGVATDPATGVAYWTTKFGSLVDATATICPDAGNMDGDDNGNGNGNGMPAAGMGSLTVTIYQCPPDADPEAGIVADCEEVDDRNGELTDTATRTSVPLSSAPQYDAATHTYSWDELAVGTYQIEPTLPGQTVTLVNVGIGAPQRPEDTFPVERDKQTFVEVFVYDDTMPPGDVTDTDGDGLYDADERDVYHTDPNNPDTDGDGYEDGQEVYFGTDPLDPNSYPDSSTRQDTDRDGLYDDDEINLYGTDPNDPDTDGDGYDDGQEVYDGTDPLDPLSNAGAGQ